MTNYDEPYMLGFKLATASTELEETESVQNVVERWINTIKSIRPSRSPFWLYKLDKLVRHSEMCFEELDELCFVGWR